MRKKKTIRNSIYGVSYSILLIVCKFVVRTVLIATLGSTYLGITGLFTNIVTLFSVVELGFGMAISTIMYKALADKDTERVKSLVRLSRKIFSAIGVFVIVAGLIFSPFLPLVAKDTSITDNIMRLYFIIFILQASFSYFNYHKALLITTDQQNFIEKIVLSVGNVLMSIMQIIMLLLWRNFIGYLIIMAIVVLFQNIAMTLVANKLYPFLKEKNIEKISEQDGKDVKKNIFALIFHKIGGAIVTSSDNIMISIFVSLGVVGVFSNYSLIAMSVAGITGQLFGAAISSVGNLWVTSTKEQTFAVFKRLNFACQWVYVFCTTCLFVLINPFIEIWIGAEYLLGLDFLIVYMIYYYIRGAQDFVSSFKYTKGLYTKDRYVPIITVVLNLGFSILLAGVFKMGIVGIMIGTVIAFTFNSIMEPIILYKFGFERNVLPFFAEYLLKMIICAGISALLYWITGLFGGGVGWFILKLFICLIVPNIIMMAIFFKNENFKYFFDGLKNKLKRSKK